MYVEYLKWHVSLIVSLIFALNVAEANIKVFLHISALLNHHALDVEALQIFSFGIVSCCLDHI